MFGRLSGPGTVLGYRNGSRYWSPLWGMLSCYAIQHGHLGVNINICFVDTLYLLEQLLQCLYGCHMDFNFYIVSIKIWYQLIMEFTNGQCIMLFPMVLFKECSIWEFQCSILKDIFTNITFTRLKYGTRVPIQKSMWIPITLFIQQFETDETIHNSIDINTIASKIHKVSNLAL